MSEWQPIETAPKDGMNFDACDIYGERTTNVSWRNGDWRHWWIDNFGSMGYVRVEHRLTHWMPIPEPPHSNDHSKGA